MNTKTNTDKFDTDLNVFVHASMTADAGPAYMLSAHYPKVCRLLEQFNASKAAAEQRQEKFNVREAVLALYRDTPTGEESVKELEDIKQTKKAVRSSDQTARFAELQKMDSKVFIQLQRLLYACSGVKALRDNKRIVHFDVRRDTKSEAILSVVIRVRMADEISAQVFTLKALQNVTAIDWNTDTPTSEVFTKANQYSATPIAPASNGDAIAPPKLAEAVKVLDTSIAGKTMQKDGGITPKAREELLALYARLHTMLSAKQRAKALASFNEGAEQADAGTEQEQADAA